MKTAILIVAAGRGSRMQDNTPKQYRKLGGQIILTRTIRCFSHVADQIPMVVAIHKDDQQNFDNAISGLDQNIHAVIGGKTRTESVRAGLETLRQYQPDIVLIHDAARPFASKRLIDNIIEKLATEQAVVPALPIVDAVKTKDGSAVDRENLVRVQTPQGFRFNDISDAYSKLPNGSDYADDIEVARTAGLPVAMCAGSEANYKLTYPSDFIRAEREINMISINGSGYDVHQICEGKSLHLCGVEIACGFSLKGHSDADVGLHAITDAILGSIAEGDIGDHFPPSDAQWKNANSRQFLVHAHKLLKSKSGVVDHVDLTLICEAPKIKPHRQAMRTMVAEILEVDLNRVSIKATTTEGLGFTGRREGIAAQASVSIRIPDV
jgi:2-C-methyl-D-erythritol 4-phosphate cytidylyltransferase/2-C-methyl-D-erythritol 2,4-cyclodiphosphate synthase